MKILSFVCIHADEKNMKKIVRKSKDVDIVICCGDFTNFGMETKEMIEFFGTKIKKPLFLIHGNHEDKKQVYRLVKKHKNIIPIHLSLAQIEEDLYIFGFGGGGFSHTEPVLEKAISQVKKKLPKDARLILVTHAPVYNTDLDYLGEEVGHRGCNSSRKFIEKIGPILSLSGHFHETFTLKDKINDTILLNAGDEGTIIEINDKRIKIKKE